MFFGTFDIFGRRSGRQLNKYQMKVKSTSLILLKKQNVIILVVVPLLKNKLFDIGRSYYLIEILFLQSIFAVFSQVFGRQTVSVGKKKEPLCLPGCFDPAAVQNVGSIPHCLEFLKQQGFATFHSLYTQ